MKKKTILILAIVTFILLAGFFVGKYYLNVLANRINKLPSGEDAIKIMNEKEKTYFENKFLKVQAHMNSSEVESILGARHKIGVNVGERRLDDWSCPDSSLLSNSNQIDCLIRGYFVDDKIVALKWVRMDHFFYEVTWEGY